MLIRGMLGECAIGEATNTHQNTLCYLQIHLYILLQSLDLKEQLYQVHCNWQQPLHSTTSVRYERAKHKHKIRISNLILFFEILKIHYR